MELHDDEKAVILHVIEVRFEVVHGAAEEFLDDVLLSADDLCRIFMVNSDHLHQVSLLIGVALAHSLDEENRFVVVERAEIFNESINVNFSIIVFFCIHFFKSNL